MVGQILAQAVDDRALWEPILLHFINHAHVYFGVLFGLRGHDALWQSLRLHQDAFHDFLAGGGLVRGVLGLLFILTVFFVFFAALATLVFVRILVVHAVVEVLVVELFVGTVELPDSDAEAQHNIFFLHQGRTDLHQTRLFGWVSLSRVERTQDHTAGRAVFQQTASGVCANGMLREFGVEVVWASILVLPELGLLKNVGELLADQVLLLLVKDVDLLLSVVEPGMIQDLFGGKSLGYVLLKHVLHKVAGEL